MNSFFNKQILKYLLFIVFFATGCSSKALQINYYTSEISPVIIIELDSNLKEVWRSKEYNHPISYTKCQNNDKLISDAYTSYIYRIDNENNIKWMYPSNGYAYPKETKDGTYLISYDSGEEEIKEVDKLGNTVWSISGKDGKKEVIKTSPNKYLVSDWKDKSLTMYDKEKNILWQNKGNLYPSSVQILNDNEYLISDAEHYRIVKINKSGEILWEYNETRGKPFVARQISNNKIIIGYKGLPTIKVIDNQGKQLDVFYGIYVNDITLMPNGNIGITGLIENKIVNKNALLLNEVREHFINCYKKIKLVF